MSNKGNPMVITVIGSLVLATLILSLIGVIVSNGFILTVSGILGLITTLWWVVEKKSC